MNIHKNARLTPKGREILIARLARGERPVDIACAMGVSVRTVYKWRKRHRDHGLPGLLDRSSRPARSPARTCPDVEARVVLLRHERRIMDRIAQETRVSRATVGRILARHGLNRWRDLEPAEPVVGRRPINPTPLAGLSRNINGLVCAGNSWLLASEPRL